jgi:oligoendopeptidase F
MNYEMALEILKQNEKLVEQYQEQFDKVLEKENCEWYDVDLQLVKVECMKLENFDEKVWEAFDLDIAWNE